MSSWHSYPSIFNLGHRAVRELLNYPHIVEEKVDGSQFSFGLIPLRDGVGAGVPYGTVDGVDCDLCIRSKGVVMNIIAPEKMFKKAAESVQQRAHLLHVGWTYRCEYLAKPQHNSLAYDRVPEGYLIGFDVSTGDNEWLNPQEKWDEFKRIGLQCVPVLAYSKAGGTTLETLRSIIDNTTSVLGGQLIEGVVIKPLGELYGVDKKTLMGKFVSERFKEVHRREWSKSNPSNSDIINQLVSMYKAEGRWLKAIQHLREAGELEDSPRDIGKLLNEIKKDTGQEQKEEIQRKLWKWAWPKVERGIVAGFPEFYKDQLLKRQFEQEPEPQSIARFACGLQLEEDDNGNA
jgi:hypothetical protein